MNDEAANALQDLLESLKTLHREGYALDYSDAVYLSHDDHYVELAQCPNMNGSGVFVTGYWVHHD